MNLPIGLLLTTDKEVELLLALIDDALDSISESDRKVLQEIKNRIENPTTPEAESPKPPARPVRPSVWDQVPAVPEKIEPMTAEKIEATLKKFKKGSIPNTGTPDGLVSRPKKKTIKANSNHFVYPDDYDYDEIPF